VQQFIANQQGQITGVLSGFDRLVFRGTLRSVRHNQHSVVSQEFFRVLSQHYRGLARPHARHESVFGQQRRVAQELRRARRTRQLPDQDLPTYITSFIGRERELAQISALLTTNRLVTLTGAGGCGKTRLALEVAASQVQHFSDGVCLSDLTPLAEASLAAQTIAFALGVQEGPAEPIAVTLVRVIQSKNMLLVLDNCEHLLQACSQVVDALLRASARLKVLTTTREIIGLTGECVFHVPPLSLPPPTLAAPPHALLEFPAVRLSRRGSH
jgi:hypothetical protein